MKLVTHCVATEMAPSNTKFDKGNLIKEFSLKISLKGEGKERK